MTVKANLKYFLIFLIYPFIWIFQGIDFSDAGFWYSNAKLFFTYPESLGNVAYLNYFSNLIAWFTGKLLPFNLLLDMRLAWAFLISLHTLLLFNFFNKNFEDKLPIYFVLFIQILFLKDITPWIGYNDLSAFFYTLIIIIGFNLNFKDDSSKNLILLGMTSAICFFLRFPNILNLGLVFIILIYKKEFKINKFLLFISGFLGFTALLFIFTSLNKQFYPLLDSWKYLINTFLHPESRYGSSSISSKLLINIKEGSLFALLTLSSVFIFYKILNFKKNILWQILIGIIFYFFYKDNILKYTFKFGGNNEPTPLLWMTGIFLIVRFKDSRWRFVILMSLIALFLGPLGSDNGMRISHFHLLPSLLFILYFIYKKNIFHLPQTILWGTLIISSLYSVKNLYEFHYRDDGNRLLKIHSPQGEFSGLLTFEQRKKEIQKLETVISEIVPKNATVLEIDNLPIIYGLSQAKPYLDSTWSSIIPLESLKRKIQEKTNQNLYPKFVFKAKYTLKNKKWPLELSPTPPNGKKDKNQIEFLNQWVKENQYRPIWRSQFFEILAK